MLYGIDYATHDIPTYILSVSENYQTCLAFFTAIRLLNYPLQALVCDENTNIFEACSHVYPHAIVQLCLNHYKENIRRSLELTTQTHYVPFMQNIEARFERKRSIDDFNKYAKTIFHRYKADSLCMKVLVDIYKSQDILCGWRKGNGIPTTNNLIESYNSHLQGRLKTIKGFESFTHADTWLNAYFLRRRIKRFTDCDKQFKHLNGYCSLELTKKTNSKLPKIFT